MELQIDNHRHRIGVTRSRMVILDKRTINKIILMAHIIFYNNYSSTIYSL